MIPAADALVAGRAANSTFEDRADAITSVERVLCRTGTSMVGRHVVTVVGCNVPMRSRGRRRPCPEVQNKPAGQEAFLPFRRPLLTWQDPLDRHSSAPAASRKRPHSPRSLLGIGFAHNSSSCSPRSKPATPTTTKNTNDKQISKSTQQSTTRVACPKLRFRLWRCRPSHALIKRAVVNKYSSSDSTPPLGVIQL